MRPYVNAVFIVGTAGRAAKKMFTKNSKPYCFFTIAIQRDWKPGQQGDAPTDWVSCVSYSPKAVEQLCDDRIKGKTVMVSGQIQTYQKDRDGRKETVMQVLAKYVNIVPPIDTELPPDVDSSRAADDEERDDVPF